MAQQRRTRDWWRATVARWRRSGRTAEAFGAREGVRPSTLRWWSSELGRATRAEHGATKLVPIEIAVPDAMTAPAAQFVEVALVGAVIRCEVGTDVAYLAALVRAMGRE